MEYWTAVHKLSSEHRICFYFNNLPDRKIIPMHELTIVFLWFPTYDSFLVPSFCKDHARSLNFARHRLWLSTTKGRNIVKLSAISQNHQFQLILTNGFNLQILKNRCKIIGKIKQYCKLKVYKFIFSEWKIVLWEDISLLAMNSLYDVKGRGPIPMVRRKMIHSVCSEDNYFPKGKFKLFNSLFHSVYLAFSIRLISIADLFALRYLWNVTRINAASWQIARQIF